MGKKNKSQFEMYGDLLDLQNQSDDFSRIFQTSFGTLIEDDEDSESFVTSKEIVETQREIEKKEGSPLPGHHDIEESVYFKRYSQRREHKYTDKEIEEIRKSCLKTIVHDYGEYDWYHISDEERMKHDQLSEIRMKLSGLRKTYRRVDQYIEAMRIAFQAWEMLAKVNYIHDPEEFFELVAEGKITSGIIMPRLKRMDQYNIDMLINYISNPELDPSHLVPLSTKRRFDAYLDEDFDDPMESESDRQYRLLSTKDAEYIYDPQENPIQIEISTIKPKYIKGYDRRKTLKKKKEKKSDRRIRESVSELLMKVQNGNHYKEHSHTYMITHSLFDPQKEEKSFWDSMRFNGSWANNDHVKLYELAVREEMMDQHPSKEKYITYGDKELDQFFSVLEANGISTIDLRRKMGTTAEDVTRKREIFTKKENKKIEGALLQRIAKLNKNEKFKKIVEKAEKALGDHRKDEI